MAAANKKKSNAYYIHCVIMLCLQFLFRFLPAPFGLPNLAMQIFGAFIGTMYGWVFINLGMPSILGMVALALSDYTTINKVLQTGFGNSTIGMLFVVFLIAAYIQSVDLNQKIVNWMLSRKFIKGRTSLFMMFYFFTIIILNLISQSWLSIIFFIDFVRSMCQKTSMKARSRESSILLQETIMVALLGSMVLPIKDQPIARMAVYTAATGVDWNPVTFAMVSIPLSIIMVVALLFINKFVLRVDYSMLANSGDLVSEDDTKLTDEQKTSVYFVIALCASMILPGFVSKDFPVLGKLGMTGCPFIVLAALLMARKNGKPVTTLKKIAAYMNWDIIFLIAAVNNIVGALASDEAGIKELISGSLSGLTSLPTFALMFVIVIISGLLTQVISNSACAAIFISVFCAMADVLPAGFSLAGMTLLVAFSTDLSCWLPTATSANALGYGQEDIIDRKYYFMAGLVNMIAELVIVGVVGTALVGVFYKGVL